MKVDLGDETAVERLIRAVPRLDVLVHLVGGFAMSPLPQTSLADFRAQLDINLVSAFLRGATKRAGGYVASIVSGTVTPA